MTRSILLRHTSGSAALLLALLVGACATTAAPPQPGPTPSGNVADTETGGMFRLGADPMGVALSIGAPPDKVWAAVPVVYEKLGIIAELNEPAQRKIGTLAYTQSRLGGKRTSDWVRCGTQGAGPSSGGMSRTRLSIVTTVRSAGEDRSELVTEVGGSSTNVEGTSTGAVACASKGDLEQRIRDLVLQELAR